MEFLVVLLLAAVFIGPTAYHLYERFRRPQQYKAAQAAKKGPSYRQRMLGMLAPVFLMFVLLILLGIGLYFAAR